MNKEMKFLRDFIPHDKMHIKHLLSLPGGYELLTGIGKRLMQEEEWIAIILPDTEASMEIIDFFSDNGFRVRQVKRVLLFNGGYALKLRLYPNYPEVTISFSVHFTTDTKEELPQEPIIYEFSFVLPHSTSSPARVNKIPIPIFKCENKPP